MVAFAITPPGPRRVALAIGALMLALATMTLSTLLNFGPAHALAWIAPATLPALFAGTAAAVAAAGTPRRTAAGLGLVAIGALVALVAQAPQDPYFAQSLHSWEQGQFVRFHGLAQWIGWLWPYAAMAALLKHIGAREP
jgi:peptidoglycan/LPS O-acetylase OafA/YrhL